MFSNIYNWFSGNKAIVKLCLENKEIKNKRRSSIDQDQDLKRFVSWYSDLTINENKDFESLGNLIAPCDPKNFVKHCKQTEIHVDGKITVVCDNHGLINDQIYFDRKCIQSLSSDNVMKVGASVSVHAYTDDRNCWRAITVTARSNTDGNVGDESSPMYTSYRESGPMIGVVTALTENGGTIENDISFEIKGVVGLYKPCVNDWVQATLENDNIAKNIKPVRIVDLTGTVTYVPRLKTPNRLIHNSYGVINSEVSFKGENCLNEYEPHVGDQVLCTAVESRQGRYQLRATSVTLILRNKSRVDPENSYMMKSWSLKGQRPSPISQRTSVPSFLPQYALPKPLYSCVVDGEDILKLLPVLNEELNIKNYAKRFTALLHLEEVSSKIESSQYSLKNVTLDSRGEYAYIEVPGIIDGKPDLSIGDMVTLQEVKDAKYTPDYQGFIHHVCIEEEYILVKFHDLFFENCNKQELFDVYFSYSRTPYRRCHLAVNFAQKNYATSMLFDEVNVKQFPSSFCHLTPVKKPYNSKLNERQLDAVKHISALSKSPMPYMLFGPPGTGKTVTLVETILQLFTKRSNTRILVCAPSNSAVDVICNRLHESNVLKLTDMVRFNCMRRVEESIPKNVQLYCRKEEEVEKIARYRIILTTCVNAGVFYNLNLKSKHFTHVCIDEAGQATEPETLIPIGLCHKGVVVMAGDPKQLGPVIKSPFALYYGLGYSLMERFMNLSCYQKDKKSLMYNPARLTKLLINYRVIHKDLLSISSELFYDSELIVAKNLWKESKFSQWEHLPNKSFPMMFHGLIGKELKESGNPSWMNPAEIIQIIRYVKLLKSELKVEESEIGIISPYRKQVQKLRIMLAAVNVHEIKIGTVEEFQGQERNVIIVSTVRSQSVPELNKHFKVDLGFVSNPKRFNVSLTRSKSLFIIVGNPFVLKSDENWARLLNKCIANKAYVGCNLYTPEKK